MGSRVVHVEIIGPDPEGLRAFYRNMFGWAARAGAPVASGISARDGYSFIPAPDAQGVPVGIGGGPRFAAHTVFYVGVDDVERALADAELNGGTRVLGPLRNEAGGVVVGHFVDPAGNLVGVAGAI